MAITAYNVTRHGAVVTVEVTADTDGPFFHWWIDGAYVGVTSVPKNTFTLEPGDQARIVCADTDDAAYDYVANAPEDFPARVTLYWPRWLGESVAYYRIEQNDGLEWNTVGRVRSEPGRWLYQWLSPRLTDGAAVAFRVIPVDNAGNDGDAVVGYGLGEFVRRPDAPSYTATATEDDPPRVEFEAA